MRGADAARGDTGIYCNNCGEPVNDRNKFPMPPGPGMYEAAIAENKDLRSRLAAAEADRPALLACERYIRGLDAADEEMHAEDCSQDYESDDPMENCDCYRIDCRKLVDAIDAARAPEQIHADLAGAGGAT